MENTYLVSIAMATYNGEKFLQDQLDSIINQSYENIEIIVVDDCSTDKTRDILQSYRGKYKNKIKVYFNSVNIGLVKNFEKALAYCKGEYIALCDQDDIWEPHKIEYLVNKIEDYSLIYSDVSLIDQNGNQLSASRNNQYNINNRSDFNFSDLVFKNFVAGCTSLFKSEMLIDIIPIPENVMFHDWWITIIASKRGGIKYIDECLVKYRQHEANVYGHRKGGWLKNVRSILFRRDSKVEEYKKRRLQLETMKPHHIFTAADRNKLDEAIEFYSTYINKGRLLYHWVLVLKYYPKITAKKCIFKFYCS